MGWLNRTPSPVDKERAEIIYDDVLIPLLNRRDMPRAFEECKVILKLTPRDRNVWNIFIKILEEIDLPPEEILEYTTQALKVNLSNSQARILRYNTAVKHYNNQELIPFYEDLLENGRHLTTSTHLRNVERNLSEARDQAEMVRQTLKFQKAKKAERKANKAKKKANKAKKKPQVTKDVPSEKKNVEAVPERHLNLPVKGPKGAALILASQLSPGLFDKLSKSDLQTNDQISNFRKLELALKSAEIKTIEQFDRLLALERVRGIEHFPYQLETVLRVLKRFHGRVLLADEVGLGKTIEAGLVMSEYLVRGFIKRALILCPASLVSQWKAELSEKFCIDASTTLDSSFKEDPKAFFSQKGILIASLSLCRLARHRTNLLAQRFDMVVVDEAHHLKNRATRGWELVNGLSSQFLLMLTATPVETNLTELYNLVTLLKPGTLGTESQFRKDFVASRDPIEPLNPEKLRELLKNVMIRNTRAQCGVDLPPRTARTVVVEPTKAEQSLYRTLVTLARTAQKIGEKRYTLYRLLMEEAGSSPNAVANTAAKASATHPLISKALKEISKIASNLKSWSKLEHLLKLLPGGKVLVFTRFLATHRAISRILKGQKIPFVSFTGSMTAQKRAESVDCFSKDIDIMLCSEVGGEGQNLQFCHRIINVDLPWNPMLIEQRIGRVHRIGQTETVEIVNLCTGGTAEEYILSVLDERLNLFELVVGEVDLLLGELEDEREFADRVYDIYASSRDDKGVEAGFEELGRLIEVTRKRVGRAREVDEKLFQDAFSV